MNGLQIKNTDEEKNEEIEQKKKINASIYCYNHFFDGPIGS